MLPRRRKTPSRSSSNGNGVRRRVGGWRRDDRAFVAGSRRRLLRFAGGLHADRLAVAAARAGDDGPARATGRPAGSPRPPGALAHWRTVTDPSLAQPAVADGDRNSREISPATFPPTRPRRRRSSRWTRRPPARQPRPARAARAGAVVSSPRAAAFARPVPSPLTHVRVLSA